MKKIILDREALWQEAETLKQSAQAETDPAKAVAYWNLAKTRMDQARKGLPVEIDRIP